MPEQTAESASVNPAVSAPALEVTPPASSVAKETVVKPGELDEFSKKLVDDTAPLPAVKPVAPAVVPEVKAEVKPVAPKPKAGGVSGVVIGAGLAILAGGLAVFLRRAPSAPSAGGYVQPQVAPRASRGGGWAQ